MRRRLGLSLFVLIAVILAPLHAAAAPTPATPRTTTQVSFALNWLKNVEFGGIWAAQKLGYWRAEGLSVTTRAYDFNTDPTVLVGAGKYTFGFQDGASIVIARAQGVPIRAVWASVQKSPFAFITMPNSGIKTVRDFKGKRIGYQSHQRYVLETMLNNAGLSLKDVKPVIVQFDPTVLVAGKIDAYLAFLTNEPIALAQGKYHLKVNVIRASDYGYKFYSDVLFTTDATIKANPELVRRVVRAMDRGWRYAVAHPAQLARLVVPALDNMDTVAQQTAEMTALGALATAPGAGIGTMTASRWSYDIDLLLKYKQIGSRLPVNSIYTTTFLPGR